MWYIYIYIYIYTIKYYSTIKNEEIPLFETTQMELESIILSEISQTVKDEYYIISYIYVILKKTKVIDTENRLFVARSMV